MKKIFLCVVILLATLAIIPDTITGTQAAPTSLTSEERSKENPELMLFSRYYRGGGGPYYRSYPGPYYRGYRYCFVATAAWDADHKNVQILREFRDRWLLKYSAGRMLVEYYYQYGPAAAEVIQEHGYLRPVVRCLLAPLVGIAYTMNSFDGAEGG